MASLEDILATAPLFAGFTPASQRALAGALKPRRLSRGDVLFRHGQRGDSMHVVVEGSFVVRCEEPDGRTVDVAQVGAGEVVGEMSALDPAPRSATEDAQVYQLDRTMLDALKSNAPSLAIALVDGLARMLTTRLRDTNERIRAATSREVADSWTPGPFPAAAAGTPYDRTIDLRKIPALGRYSDAELARLAEVAPPVLYRDGEYLCREGQPGDACFILAGGKVDVVKELRDGRQKVLASLGSGTIVGQLALLDDTARSASIRALGNAGVLVIQRQAFRDLLASFDSLAIKLHEQVTVAGVRQLRLANEHITRLLATAPAPPPAAAPEPEPEPEQRPLPTRESAPQAPRGGPKTRPGVGTKQWSPPRAPPRGPKRPVRPPARGPADKPASEPLWRAMMRRRGSVPENAPKKQETDKAREWVQSRIPKQGEVLTGKALLNEDYLSAALGEWGMSLEDLDRVQVVRPDGQMSQAELKARMGK